ncbi:hypothetical protein CAOG_001188 [Capsaspora owczarzaki ATCC 30864]|uniref:Uncharacterized protein n=1 Tax=Capsaspora owczarzaki (strain ATCC 30864) TaxID=595528 RepID=A0A0D2X0W3_CAPO3|nr:hypothetical protein CAOG_001188 [Capsaspora owczarzaki ATCC 30864]
MSSAGSSKRQAVDSPGGHVDKRGKTQSNDEDDDASNATQPILTRVWGTLRSLLPSFAALEDTSPLREPVRLPQIEDLNPQQVQALFDALSKDMKTIFSQQWSQKLLGEMVLEAVLKTQNNESSCVPSFELIKKLKGMTPEALTSAVQRTLELDPHNAFFVNLKEVNSIRNAQPLTLDRPQRHSDRNPARWPQLTGDLVARHGTTSAVLRRIFEAVNGVRTNRDNHKILQIATMSGMGKTTYGGFIKDHLLNALGDPSFTYNYAGTAGALSQEQRQELTDLIQHRTEHVFVEFNGKGDGITIEDHLRDHQWLANRLAVRGLLNKATVDARAAGDLKMFGSFTIDTVIRELWRRQRAEKQIPPDENALLIIHIDEHQLARESFKIYEPVDNTVEETHEKRVSRAMRDAFTAIVTCNQALGVKDAVVLLLTGTSRSSLDDLPITQSRAELVRLDPFSVDDCIGLLVARWGEQQKTMHPSWRQCRSFRQLLQDLGGAPGFVSVLEYHHLLALPLQEGSVQTVLREMVLCVQTKVKNYLATLSDFRRADENVLQLVDLLMAQHPVRPTTSIGGFTLDTLAYQGFLTLAPSSDPECVLVGCPIPIVSAMIHKVDPTTAAFAAASSKAAAAFAAATVTAVSASPAAIAGTTADSVTASTAATATTVDLVTAVTAVTVSTAVTTADFRPYPLAAGKAQRLFVTPFDHKGEGFLFELTVLLSQTARLRLLPRASCTVQDLLGVGSLFCGWASDRSLFARFSPPAQLEPIIETSNSVLEPSRAVEGVDAWTGLSCTFPPLSELASSAHRRCPVALTAPRTFGVDMWTVLPPPASQPLQKPLLIMYQLKHQRTVGKGDLSDWAPKAFQSLNAMSAVKEHYDLLLVFMVSGSASTAQDPQTVLAANQAWARSLATLQEPSNGVQPAPDPRVIVLIGADVFRAVPFLNSRLPDPPAIATETTTTDF